MSKIIFASLLLLLLVDSCRSAALPPGLHVAKRQIRMCRCRVFGYGKMKCPYPLIPTSHEEERDLIKCLCSKASHKFPQLQASVCTSWRSDYPIPLL